MSRWLFSTNAKDIGMLYLMFGLFSGMIGTAFSVLIRLELASPGAQYLQEENQLYNVIVTACAFLMIFFMVIFWQLGIFRMGRVALPLMDATASLAYSRLNNISFWLLPPLLILLLSSSLLEGETGTGWTYYRFIIITTTTIFMCLGIFNLINLQFKLQMAKWRTLLTYITLMFLFNYLTGLNSTAIDKELVSIGNVDCIIAILMMIGLIFFLYMVCLLLKPNFSRSHLFIIILLLTVILIILTINLNNNVLDLEDTDTDKVTFTVSTTGTAISNLFNKVTGVAGSAVGIYASTKAVKALASYMMANPKAPKAPGYIGMAFAGSIGMASLAMSFNRQSSSTLNPKIKVQPAKQVNDYILTKPKSVDNGITDFIQCPLEEFEMYNGSICSEAYWINVPKQVFFLFILLIVLILLFSSFVLCLKQIFSLVRKLNSSSLKLALSKRAFSAQTLMAIPFIDFELDLTEQDYYFLMLISMRCFISIGIYASFCLIIVHFMSNYQFTIPVKFLDKLIKKIYNRFNNSKIVLYFIILLSQWILMFEVLIVMPSFIVN